MSKYRLNPLILGLSSAAFCLAFSPYTSAKTISLKANQYQWLYHTLELKEGQQLEAKIQNTLPADEAEFEVINAKTGKFRFKSKKSSGTQRIVLQIKDKKGKSSPLQVDFQVQGDPHFEYQWAIHNTGQTALADNPGIAGADINLLPVIADGITGKGVRVAVVDDGVDLNHPELVDRATPEASHFSALDGSNNPRPRKGDAMFHGKHGTMVAGIIGATAWNNEGVRGVAPGVSLTGFQYIVQGDTKIARENSFAHFLEVYGFTERSKNIAIFNQSFGEMAFQNIPARTLEAAMIQIEKNHASTRNGLGALYVKSAGNYFERITRQTEIGRQEIFQSDQNRDYPLTITSADPQANIFQSIVVTATNAKDQRASYSNVGPAAWIAAPGGEDGFQGPTHFTTDISFNCGHVQNTGPEDAKNYCSTYTRFMNGTSAAAPHVSGVIALMLEVNPKLGWRDVKAILAKTAKKVDPNLADLQLAVGSDQYLTKLGWQQNAAGYSFSPTYGFGRIDAATAVQEARQYKQMLPKPTITPWQQSKVDQLIPDQDINGTVDSIQVNQNATIESVQVKLNIEHSNLLQLAVELISPAGTVSQLIYPFSAGPEPAYSLAEEQKIQTAKDQGLPEPKIRGGIRDNLIRTNAFYGENAQGEWKLRVIDLSNGKSSIYAGIMLNEGIQSPTGRSFSKDVDYLNDDQGKLENWSIRIMGH